MIKLLQIAARFSLATSSSFECLVDGWRQDIQSPVSSLLLFSDGWVDTGQIVASQNSGICERLLLCYEKCDNAV